MPVSSCVSDKETLAALSDCLRVPSCVAALRDGEPAIAACGTVLEVAGIHVQCVTVPRCLLLWAVSHSVICLAEKGERGTMLAMLQRLCLGLTEAAPAATLKKVRAFQTYLNM